MTLNSYFSSNLYFFPAISTISGYCVKRKKVFAVDLSEVVEASAAFASFCAGFCFLSALFYVATAASSVSFCSFSHSRWSIHLWATMQLLLRKTTYLYLPSSKDCILVLSILLSILSVAYYVTYIGVYFKYLARLLYFHPLDKNVFTYLRVTMFCSISTRSANTFVYVHAFSLTEF